LIDGTGKSKLPPIPPNTGFNRIKHFSTENGVILNLETSVDVGGVHTAVIMKPSM
jgi:hypothetical protein